MRGLQLLLISLIFIIPTKLYSQNAGDLDLSFNPNDVGYFHNGNFGVANDIALQSDGKVIANRYNIIVRFQSNGLYDSSFNSVGTFSSEINVIAVQNDDKILVGGRFDAYSGVVSNKFLRLLPDGGLDTNFNVGSGFDNTIYDIQLLNNGRILVCGNFNTYDGDSVSGIIRLHADGSLDTNFTSAGLFTGTNYLFDIACAANGDLYVGGSFAEFNNHSTTLIAKLDSTGLIDTTFIQSGIQVFQNSFLVRDIALQNDGKIIVAGKFHEVVSNTITRSGLIRLESDGLLDATFSPIGFSGDQSTVNRIWLQNDGKILCGGEFTEYDSVPASRLVRLNTNSTIDQTFDVGVGCSDDVKDVYVQSDGKVLVGGRFDKYQETGRIGLIRLNQDASVDQSFVRGSGFNNVVAKIVVDSVFGIFCSGRFSDYNGNFAYKVAKLNYDGSMDTTFDAREANGTNIQHLIVQPDGKVLLSGNFDGGRMNLKRVNANGSLDQGFNYSLIGQGSTSLGTIVQLLDNGNCIVGDIEKLHRILPSGLHDGSFPTIVFDDFIWSIKVQADGKIIVAGSFTQIVGGQSFGSIVRFNSNGSIDTTFNQGGVGFDDVVYGVFIQDDGKIIANGLFDLYNGQQHNGFMRLNPDGSVDNSFNAGYGFNYGVNEVEFLDDGRIVCAGTFLLYDSIADYPKLICLNSDGSIYTPFDLGTGFETWDFNYSYIDGMAVQDDGRLLVGGDFWSLDGVGRNRICRIHTNTTTNIEIPALEDQAAWLFPNPTNSNLNLLLKYNRSDLDLRIYNVVGKEVYQTVLSQSSEFINVSNLSPGIYFLIYDDQKPALKFVVE